MIEVFADITCPFAHVGLHRITSHRRALGRSAPRLRVRAWPLERVNGEPLSGAGVAPKVAALRAQVAPDLFGGFDVASFPPTTLPALAAEVAAQRVGDDVGEAFSIALRDAVFERGEDVADPDVLDALRSEHGVPRPGPEDDAAVLASLAEGRRRGVIGSPHFFTPAGDLFCPSLRILHEGNRYDISVDADGFGLLVGALFAA